MGYKYTSACELLRAANRSASVNDLINSSNLLILPHRPPLASLWPSLHKAVPQQMQQLTLQHPHQLRANNNKTSEVRKLIHHHKKKVIIFLLSADDNVHMQAIVQGLCGVCVGVEAGVRV